MSAPIGIPHRSSQPPGPMSPASSVSSNKKLTTRRGSIAAFDPHGSHSLVNNSPRTSSSTLTIVRLSAGNDSHLPQTSHFPLQQPDPSNRRHRRHGSNSSMGSASSQTSGSGPVSQPARMSFAFSSFGGSPRGPPGPASYGSPGGAASPSSSSRPRSGSGGAHGPQRPTTFGNPRLSPDQLYDLAKKATNPLGASPMVSPGQPRNGRSSPMGRPSSPMRPSSPHARSVSDVSSSDVGQGMAPATFTPMPDEVHLPFIDRPGEVASLIASAPSSKLFSLLAQTFPVAAEVTNNKDEIPSDPFTWNFGHLHLWLTQVDRTTVPDALWVLLARRCIMSRSELIWERVKGALGVPPELDVDVEYITDTQARLALRQQMDTVLGHGAYDDAVHSSDGESSVERTSGRPLRAPRPSQASNRMPESGHWPGWDSAGSVRGSSGNLASLGVNQATNLDAVPVTAADSNVSPKPQDAALLKPSDAEGSSPDTHQREAFSADLGDRLNELKTAAPEVTDAHDLHAGAVKQLLANRPTLASPPKTDAGANSRFMDTYSTDTGGDSTISATPAATATPKRGNSLKKTKLAEQHFPIAPSITSPPPPAHQFGNTGSNMLPSASTAQFLSTYHDSPVGSSPSESPVFPMSPPFTPSVSIEPLLSGGSFSNLPPSSLPVSLAPAAGVSPGASELGLQDISEDAEEAEEDEGVSKGIEEALTPPECHGLRISTSPLPSSSSLGAYANSNASSPVVGSRSRRHSLTRSGSFGAGPASYGSISRSTSFAATGGEMRHDGDPANALHRFRTGEDLSYEQHEDVPYDPVADRGPGNPLFPSNFARLSLGPTLSENNASLRSPMAPPAPKYGSPHFTLGSGPSSSVGVPSGFMPTQTGPSARGNRFDRRVPSWAEGWDVGKQEYAVTLSGSSIGGRE